MLRKYFKFILTSLVFLSPISPTLVFAADGSSVDGILQNFLGYLTGTVGATIASIAVVGLGFGCFAMGRVSKTAFFSTAVGVALIFGAKAFISTLQG